MAFRDNSFSFSLIRTNPTLSANIKLTLDSNDRIWLNSIDSNEELSKDVYKRYPINYNYSHTSNIMKFLNRGNVSQDILFDVFKSTDPEKVSHQLKDQYDFSLYFAGAKYLKSVQYDEKFSYFSPIYINKLDIPQYFIILKIDDPINDKISNLDQYKESLYNNKKYMYDLLSKSTIIKTFDLRKGTIIGDYLRNNFNDPLFPKSPLSVNFNKDEMTYWKGIDIHSGVYSEIGEYLYDFYKTDHPVKYFEKYITEGYKRHGLIFPNIINIEFLFNDETSNVLEHNRYIGFYVNESDISNFNIDVDNLKHLSNFPKIYNEINPLDKTNLELSNDDGIELSSFNNIDTKSNNLNLGIDNQVVSYIRDKYSNFYNIKDIKDNKISLKSRKIDIYDFIGADNNVHMSDSGIIAKNISKSSILMKINSMPISGESLVIYHRNGSRIGIDGKRFDEILFTSGFDENKIYGSVGEYFTQINNNTFDVEYKSPSNFKNYWNTIDSSIIQDPNDGDYFIINQNGNSSISYNELFIYLNVDDVDPILFNNLGEINSYKNGDIIKWENNKWIYNPDVSDDLNYYYVGIGELNDIGLLYKTIIRCINEFPIKDFELYYHNGEIIITTNRTGDNDSSIGIRFNSNDERSDILYFDGEYDDVTGLYYCKNGSETNNILLVDDIHKNDIDLNKHVVRTKCGYSKIKKIIRYSGDLYRNISGLEISKAFGLYKNYIGLELESTEVAYITSGKFEISSIYNVPVGMLSFYGVKDFDFDFTSSRYTTFPYWELYGDYYVPKKINCLKEGTCYGVICYDSESLTYDGQNYSKGDVFICKSDNSYFESNDDAFVIPLFKLKTGIIQNSNISYIEDLDFNYGLKFNHIKPIYINIPDDDEIIVYSIHDQNPDISQFSGFYNLTEQIDNINTDDIKYVYRDKYTSGLSNSEYEYNKENNSPDFATHSKLVPFSCKWAYDGGVDVRNNPYRLNTSLAFGINNFSPSHNINKQSSKNITHEWYYLVSDIISTENDKFSVDNYCYIDREKFEKLGITYNNQSIDIDNDFNFIDTFSDLGAVDRQYYKYSNIQYNPISETCETFFRGVKLNIGDITNSNNIKYDGYKFTAVLNPIKYPTSHDEDNINNLSSPIEIILFSSEDVYSLKDQKFIILIINIYVDDYNDIKTKLGHIDDELDISDHIFNKEDGYTYLENLYPETDEPNYKIDGDYKLDPNQISYSKLYSLKHKKSNYMSDIYSNIRIYEDLGISKLIGSGESDIESNIYKSGVPYYGTMNYNNPYVYDLTKSIKNFNDNNILLYRNNTNIDRVYGAHLVDSSDNSIVYVNPLFKSYIESILFKRQPSTKLSPVYYDGEYNIDFFGSYTRYVYQLMGGRNYYESLLSYISFSNIKNIFNNSKSYMNIGKCSIKIQDDSIIEKSSYLIKNEIVDNITIGYNYSLVDSDSPYYVYRYQGQYTPIFKDILYFTSDSEDISNSKFASDVNNYATINNFYHLKISEQTNSLFKYGGTKSIFPLKYELNDEINIGIDKFNILHSSWDIDFHKIYKTKSVFDRVPGSLRIEEYNTFINNLISVPDNINLTKFNSRMVDDILSVNINDEVIVYQIIDNKVTGKININNILVQKLKELGIDKCFELLKSDENQNKYIGNISINDYIYSYIIKNIIPLYNVSNVDVFVKKTEGDNKFTIYPDDLYDINLSTLILDKDIKINKNDKYILTFEYIIRNNFNSELYFDINVKLI